jgi:AraC-like DNA-binding protein
MLLGGGYPLMQITKQENPILQTTICDLCIESVLDTGFINEFEIISQTHSHPCYELIVNIDGEFCVAFSEAEAIHLETGAICLIPPGVYHCTRSISLNPRKLAIRFNCTRRLPADLDRPLYDTYLAGFSAHKASLIPDKDSMLYKLLQLIRQELTAPGLAVQPYLESLLTQFYILLIRIVCNLKQIDTASVKTSDLQRMRWLKIEDFLDLHYAEPITETDLAQNMHLSKRQLSRVLQQIYNTSFRQLLIDMRLNRAAQLLAGNAHSVQEVAEMVGYTSLSGFYIAFRHKYGVAPGEYKLNTCENRTWRDI